MSMQCIHDSVKRGLRKSIIAFLVTKNLRHHRFSKCFSILVRSNIPITTAIAHTAKGKYISTETANKTCSIFTIVGDGNAKSRNKSTSPLKRDYQMFKRFMNKIFFIFEFCLEREFHLSIILNKTDYNSFIYIVFIHIFCMNKIKC